MASGIKGSGNRPKTAKHLRGPQEKVHTNRTKEERDRDHAVSDAWAERQRAAEPEREAARVKAAREARKAELKGSEW